jgi:hypothetical protein
MVAHPDPDPETLQSQIRGLTQLVKVMTNKLETAESLIDAQEHMINVLSKQNELLTLQVNMLKEAS